MDLQATKQINIDVSKHKYILLDAKQYDRNLRYVLITCYHQGSFLPINKNTCFASIRYRKPDNYGVFNTCEITQDGKILVELTEQMLAVAGLCYADVVIHENMELRVEINEIKNDDGIVEAVEIKDEGDSGIISTMTFVVNVYEAAFDNEEVESSYEYNALNDLLTEARRNYDAVMESCNESEANAKVSEDNAKASETAAKTSESNAKASENRAKASETAAKTSENNAKTSETNAEASETAAKISETNAKASENNALNDANRAQSYAVGGTGTRTGEDNDNAKYYYELSARVAEGLVGGFIPIGTITFVELESAEKVIGYVYNISDDFTTDDSFREGAGKSYTAGTNVYYTANGQWDCLGGAAPVVATVSEVREFLGIQDGEIIV